MVTTGGYVMSVSDHGMLRVTNHQSKKRSGLGTLREPDSRESPQKPTKWESGPVVGDSSSGPVNSFALQLWPSTSL